MQATNKFWLQHTLDSAEAVSAFGSFCLFCAVKLSDTRILLDLFQKDQARMLGEVRERESTKQETTVRLNEFQGKLRPYFQFVRPSCRRERIKR